MRFLAAGFMIAFFLIPGEAMAGKTGKALMLTVFGTSTEASVTFDELLPLVRTRFPDRDVVIPYTSGIIRNKLNAVITDPAARILSPSEMLERLKTEGYKDIAVVSTLLFPGVEHDRLKKTVDEFADASSGIKVTYVQPLLGVKDNLQPAVAVLAKYLIRDGINVVVAHGTHEGHPVEKRIWR